MKEKRTKIIVSILLIAISYAFIIYKLLQFEELKKFNLKDIWASYTRLYYIGIVLILMFLNWSVEAFKWKLLIEKIQQINFLKALKAVFAGISVGIFTPNRVGEIGGRVLFLEKGKRTFGLLATSLGGFAQFITTLINGLMGLILFLLLYPDKTQINQSFNTGFSFLVLFVLVFFIWLYFNTPRIKPILLKIRFFKTRTSQLDYFSQTKASLLFIVLLISILRYLIFISQFFLLLIFFDIDLSIIQAYVSISLIYLCSTLIPTTTLVELGIRGSLAIFFIGIFTDNVLGILFSSFFLWIINLVIPSIIGSVLFIKNNV